ncbi:MAG: phosphoribosylformylglycinamidine cyclo-ligase [Alphaproteobacteria bacterium CG1_02_46_17]|nr:MAG: phosphoribosylformylglycinamidine cyclo-ligase [Alphaproteobacteria bacterium CG1_02_46_17]
MKQSAYKDSGVDIEAGDALVERIKPMAKSTHRAGIMGGLGGFGALFDVKAAGYQDPVIVSSTDGVGTKIRVAIDCNIHNTVGVDLVAMCVNDLIVQGAEPLFFLDYFASSKLNVDVAADVVSGIAEGCRQAGCALIGGETAEMPGMYAEGDYDLAGFTVGAVERNKMLTGQHIQEGDIVLGLAASGLHSNGFSLVRKLIADQSLTYQSPLPYDTDRKISDEVLIPTRIYIKSLLPLVQNTSLIKGLANITGGGLLENIPRVIPEGLAIDLDASAWELPPVFRWLKQAGQIGNEDLARTLNCGIGMVAIVRDADVTEVIKLLTDAGETVFSIGKILTSPRETRVHIHHMEENWN